MKKLAFVAALAALCVAVPLSSGSSHREAPLTAIDPTGDDIDTYAFTAKDAPGALTAGEIADDDGSAQLDLATVYRNLETLEELELAVRVQAGEGAARWRLATGGGKGYVACHRCGGLDEMGVPELDDLAAALRERFGYEVSFSRFPLIGVCAGCRPAASG